MSVECGKLLIRMYCIQVTTGVCLLKNFYGIAGLVRFVSHQVCKCCVQVGDSSTMCSCVPYLLVISDSLTTRLLAAVE
jgi:hypothetical protein